MTGICEQVERETVEERSWNACSIMHISTSVGQRGQSMKGRGLTEIDVDNIPITVHHDVAIVAIFNLQYVGEHTICSHAPQES